MLKEELTQFYSRQDIKLSSFTLDDIKNEYSNASFLLNAHPVIYRKAKITPKKVGQFVAIWKRDTNNNTAPFDESDTFDCYIIEVSKEEQKGHFIFPKSVLLAKDIISGINKKGKRGFRLYPPWDITASKQAISTQKWQLNYFINLKNPTRENNNMLDVFR